MYHFFIYSFTNLYFLLLWFHVQSTYTCSPCFCCRKSIYDSETNRWIAKYHWCDYITWEPFPWEKQPMYDFGHCVRCPCYFVECISVFPCMSCRNSVCYPFWDTKTNFCCYRRCCMSHNSYSAPLTNPQPTKETMH